MFAITVRKNRTQDFTVALDEADGDDLVLAADDKVRFKAFRRDGSTPDLDLDNVGATANGSVVTVVDVSTGSVTLRIAQGDTATLPLGIYSCEVAVVDNSETAPADAIKFAERGVMYLLESGGGDVGVS